MPKPNPVIDWNADEFEFEFELGLTPTFELTWNQSKEYEKYSIQLEEEELDDHISNLRTRFGKFEHPQDIKESNHIILYYRLKGQEKNESTDKDTQQREEEFHGTEITLKVDDLAEGEAKQKILDCEKGDILEVSPIGLLKDEEKLLEYFQLDVEKIKDVPIKFEIKIDNYLILTQAELNQEFFDKVSSEKKIGSTEELKSFISERFASDYQPKTRQLFLNEVMEDLIQDTQFDLPDEFLTKWIARSNEKISSDADAKSEYERSKKGIRYQIIENKLVKLFSINISEDQVRDTAKTYIRNMMTQYRKTEISDQELDGLANSLMKEQKDADRFHREALNKKLYEKLFEKINTIEKITSQKELVRIIEKRDKSKK